MCLACFRARAEAARGRDGFAARSCAVCRCPGLDYDTPVFTVDAAKDKLRTAFEEEMGRIMRRGRGDDAQAQLRRSRPQWLVEEARVAAEEEEEAAEQGQPVAAEEE